MSDMVKIDDSELVAWLNKAPDRIKQAALDGLNRTQEEALIAGKREVVKSFVQRDPNFISRMPTGQDGAPIPRHWRASLKGSQSALIAIGDAGSGGKLGLNRLNILEPFEQGKDKKAHTMPVAIPTRALRPDFRQAIPKALHPRFLLGQYNLDGGFTGLGRGKDKHTKLGPKRSRSLYSYFIVPKSAGRGWGIYERTGPGKARMIWAFRDSIKRPSTLRWVETTGRVARSNVEANVGNMIVKAIQGLFAKGSGAMAAVPSRFK